MNSSIVIATRPSKLALWQANHVKSLLQTRGVKVELKEITTKGDRVLDRSLVEIGGKGLFLKEIEDALLDGSADIAVHSMKDVPYALDDRLVLASILPREDPRDAFLSARYQSLETLPQGATVGTTSLRRITQLKRKRSDLNFTMLRGNVDTRIRKLDDGQYDAIILAAAGLKRLGLESRITDYLDIVSAGGQGAIGIECRKDRSDLLSLLSTLNHVETYRCVMLERAFMKRVQGSCQTPVGCAVKTLASNSNQFWLRWYLANPDGTNECGDELTGMWQDANQIVSEINLTKPL